MLLAIKRCVEGHGKIPARQLIRLPDITSWMKKKKALTSFNIHHDSWISFSKIFFITKHLHAYIRHQHLVCGWWACHVLPISKNREAPQNDIIKIKTDTLATMCWGDKNSTWQENDKYNYYLRKENGYFHPTFCLAQLCRFPAMRGQSSTFTDECLKTRRVSSSWVCITPSCMR